MGDMNGESLTTGTALIRSYFWLAVGVCGVLALFVLGAQSIAVGVLPLPFDKLVHALVFAGLFLVLDAALVLPLWLAVLIPLLVSAADEFHQIFLPGRQADLLDWLSGLCGVLLVAIWRNFRA